MKFLKLVQGEWVVIDNDQLVREVPDDKICMMIFFKATVRVGSYQYRKYVPAIIRDWAIINS